MLDKAVKDMLVERAEDTIRHLWNETGGEPQSRDRSLAVDFFFFCRTTDFY